MEALADAGVSIGPLRRWVEPLRAEPAADVVLSRPDGAGVDFALPFPGEPPQPAPALPEVEDLAERMLGGKAKQVDALLRDLAQAPDPVLRRDLWQTLATSDFRHDGSLSRLADVAERVTTTDSDAEERRHAAAVLDRGGHRNG